MGNWVEKAVDDRGAKRRETKIESRESVLRADWRENRRGMECEQTHPIRYRQWRHAMHAMHAIRAMHREENPVLRPQANPGVAPQPPRRENRSVNHRVSYKVGYKRSHKESPMAIHKESPMANRRANRKEHWLVGSMMDRVRKRAGNRVGNQPMNREAE